jgi:hypothetical protein
VSLWRSDESFRFTAAADIASMKLPKTWDKCPCCGSDFLLFNLPITENIHHEDDYFNGYCAFALVPSAKNSHMSHDASCIFNLFCNLSDACLIGCRRIAAKVQEGRVCGRRPAGPPARLQWPLCFLCFSVHCLTFRKKI